MLSVNNVIPGFQEPSSDAPIISPEPVVQFGREGSGPGEFGGPFGITVGHDGLLYVADDLAHRVLVFDRSGQLRRTLGRHGTAPGEVAWVDGVAVDRNGDLYVADTGNNRIQVWDKDGRFLREFGRTWWNPLRRLRNPRSVKIGPDGLLYVADFYGSVIRVYTKTGSAVRVIGRAGQGAGDLHPNAHSPRVGGPGLHPNAHSPRVGGPGLHPNAHSPHVGGPGLQGPLGMDFGGDSLLYVADSGNHRVQVFRLDGRFVRSFGSKGEGPGQFNRPHAVVVLSEQRLLIVDHANDRLQVVDLEGKPLAVLSTWARTARPAGAERGEGAPASDGVGGSGGAKPPGHSGGALRRPTSAAVSSDGVLYVVDQGNHRVLGWAVDSLNRR